MTTTTPIQHEIEPSIYNKRWAILAVLCTSLMIVIIGNTALNVAIPTLARELEASTSSLQWMVDAYGLVFAGLLFTAGTIGDRFGRKGALQAGLTVFLFGTLLASTADSAAVVTGARAIMGLAAAFIMPSTLSILTNVFPAHERPKAIAVWAGISGAGAAVGPVASGFLLEHFYWGSVFLVNVPMIAGALIAGAILLPKSKDPEESPLDFLGAFLSIVGLVALVYSIIEGPAHGWLSGESILHLRHRHRGPGPVRPLGVQGQVPDARPPPVPGPALQRGLGRHDADLLRHVRHLLPGGAVLPAGPGLLAARVGPAPAARWRPS